MHFPTIFPTPECPRLIDTGLIHHEASLAGFAERYGRGETSHTIHVWWARRPHKAMRALIYASLCKNEDVKEFEKLASLMLKYDEPFYSSIRSQIYSQYGYKPKVLDMFSGGGTIPAESSLLGADAYCVEANPLAVFINKSNLLYCQSLENKDNFLSILENVGNKVLSSLYQSTLSLFPARLAESNDSSHVYSYLWTYQTKCSSCDYSYYLLNRFWLSKKKGKRVAIQLHKGDGCDIISIVNDAPNDFVPNKRWQKVGKVATCPSCGNQDSGFNIGNLVDIPIVEISVSAKSGKTFSTIQNDLDNNLIKSFIKTITTDLDIDLPSSNAPIWSGIVNPALYGCISHADTLNIRQQAFLLGLIKSLKGEHVSLTKTHGQSYADCIIAILSSFIDQVVDWDCRFTTWISQNEQVGRGFCGPGISMYWDYVESDLVLSGPANLHGKLSRILKGVTSILRLPTPVNVYHGSAQSLPFGNSTFDAIVTDPPYYDNLFYSVLSDYFYSWKRLLLADVFPEEFLLSKAVHSDELVASSNRSGDSSKAHEFYTNGMGKALQEASRVLKKDGVLSFIYSHRSINGWLAIIDSFRSSALRINGVHPLSIERKQRPRAIRSEAINTCIAFVARKVDLPRVPISSSFIFDAMGMIIKSDFSASLHDAGWSSEDIALSLFAQSVGLLSNHSGIDDSDDSTVLQKIVTLIKKDYPNFNIVNRRSI